MPRLTITYEVEPIPLAHGGGFHVTRRQLGIAVTHTVGPDHIVAHALKVLSAEVATLDVTDEAALVEEVDRGLGFDELQGDVDRLEALLAERDALLIQHG